MQSIITSFNIWAKIGTKYQKRRIKIIQEYLYFIYSQNFNAKVFIKSNLIFSKANIRQFLLQTKYEKNITATHLSEGLRHIALNKIDNYESFLLQSKATLKNIPEITYILDGEAVGKKKSKKSVKNEISTRTLTEAYIQHINFDHKTTPNTIQNSHVCRTLFLAFTGLRFQSSLNLQSNSQFSIRKCKHCYYNNPCKNTEYDCFDRLNLYDTKTTSANLPLIDNIKNCFLFIKLIKDQDYTRTSTSFNAHLKINYSITSHALRRYLVNFVSQDKSNTGNWSNQNTQRKFYQHPEYKFKLIHHYLNSLGFQK